MITSCGGTVPVRLSNVIVPVLTSGLASRRPLLTLLPSYHPCTSVVMSQLCAPSAALLRVAITVPVLDPPAVVQLVPVTRWFQVTWVSFHASVTS